MPACGTYYREADTMQTSKFINQWIWSRTSQKQMTERDKDLFLLRRISEGDNDAVRELYAQYGQRLYAYALRITNDPATAEDVVQHTLVTVWKTAKNFRGESRLLTWLLGIVHHTAIKMIRSKTEYLHETAQENIPQNQPTLEEQAQGQETKRWIQDGLQSLSSEHRMVLELVFYQGLSLNEVAQVLKLPLGTVKSRLSYARNHLRGVLTRTQENI